MQISELAERLQMETRMPSRGDSDLNPDMAPLRDRLIPAAVLIPVIDHDRDPAVLLTRRTATLKDHAGQIAFPGGRIDPEDEDAIAAALREAREEVGIPERAVDVIGTLPTYITRTGYSVTPVIGSIRPPVQTRPEPAEVDAVFEVPLSFLLDRSNHQRHTRRVAGIDRHFFAMPYGEHYIWGATAGMIVSLADMLDRATGPCPSQA